MTPASHRASTVPPPPPGGAERRRTSLAARTERLAGRATAHLRDSRRLRAIWSRVHNLYYFADLARHDDMLADRARVDAYHEALERHVHEGDEVVDLGTGSGVLSCLAARAGARRVHAVEYGPIIEAAQRVAAENGIENITFHRVSSRELSLPHRVDVIVHEQMGAALFNEHLLANVVDLRDRVLKPGGRILPGRLELVVAPIQADERRYAPFAWEQEIHGLTFRALKAYAEEHPEGYAYRAYNPLPLEALLAEPAAVVTVDLHTVEATDVPRRLRYAAPALREGVLHGFCVYFTAHFDETLALTSDPVHPGRAVHWAVPVLRAARREVRPGDLLRLDLDAADLAVPSTWRWDVDVTAARDVAGAPVS